MASASKHSQVVQDYLANECAAGRIIGPLPLSDFPTVQVISLDVIPKKKPREVAAYHRTYLTKREEALTMA